MQASAIGKKLLANVRWLPAYLLQRLGPRQRPKGNPLHIMIALADHFEPSMTHEGRLADLREQEDRLRGWCEEYPRAGGSWRDSDGRPFQHTYFFPAEQYHASLIRRLADHCRTGWGEIEIHLHHGIHAPDTAANTRSVISRFRDVLASMGCLAHVNGDSSPRYAFVHGNWALANSGQGMACGVDDEMKVLAETGCYADFTLPSAPHPAQVSKINSIYECGLPLEQRVPHRRGRDLEVGRVPKIYPLIVQGPLMLDFSRFSARSPYPAIENGELAAANPPTLNRFELWKQASVMVKGRADWLLIKLHCHSLDPREQAGMSGAPMSRFLEGLTALAEREDYRLHFVTAREMVNIILAACDSRDGNPGLYRDYKFQLSGKSNCGDQSAMCERTIRG